MTCIHCLCIARPHQKENPVIIDIPLGFVSRVEKVGGARTPGDNYGLDIICKVANIESADRVLICTEKYLNDHMFVVRMSAT